MILLFKLISIKITFDENKYIKEIHIEGHAPVNESFSLECSIVSTLAETMYIAFKDIYKNSNLEKENGKLKITIMEKDKKIREDIERFIYPFLVMFKKISTDFKNSVLLQFIKK